MSQKEKWPTIVDNRKKKYYRFLEGLIGYFSISIILFFLIGSIWFPAVIAILLIAYSFLMVLKLSLHSIYTIYTYKNLTRWEKFNWIRFLECIQNNFQEAVFELEWLRDKYPGKLDWKQRINKDIQNLKAVQETKFKNPNQIYHFPIFSTYNESAEVLIHSLKGIFECRYDLTKIFVVITQEARMGQDWNDSVFEKIVAQDWICGYKFSEDDLEIVYSDEHQKLQYENIEVSKISPKKGKLTVIFTQHPDGLVGEIKGKASNEDWAGRQISLFVKAKKLDPNLVMLTSLDSDSRTGPNFFQTLSFRYCITPNRSECGFQPIPVYSNNYFEANLFPKLVAANTTIWHMIQYSLADELHFFANYSVPLVVLQKVDFWVREVIAEDNLLFAKCLIRLQGKFEVVPFYSTFEGDAIEGEDYLETIANQFKQLQRWAWGGIEGFPYKFYHFFVHPDGTKIDLRLRLKFTFNEFLNHFFWSTSPVIFSLIIALPPIIGSILRPEFAGSPLNTNLWLLSQSFAIISFIFLLTSMYISFSFIASKALRYRQARWYDWLIIVAQWLISPVIYFLWGYPATNAQIRGIFGNYLGYWVSPKTSKNS